DYYCMLYMNSGIQLF
nr:immunoglobulin light chain junction region [Macaca mulatta]